MQVTDIKQLTGKNDEFIACDASGKGLHHDILEPLKLLKASACERGFDLTVVSGHRGFERQLHIWNAKASGTRSVLNDQGVPIDMNELSPWQQVQAILRWSALPGASRHHWGTDIDVYDKAAVPDTYSPELTIKEVEDCGPFGPMHCWLDECIAGASSFGFFRPYSCDSGGIAPERWHLSYAPLSSIFQSYLTIEHLVEVISKEPLELKEVVLGHIDEIFYKFINIPVSRYPKKYQSCLQKSVNKN